MSKAGFYRVEVREGPSHTEAYFWKSRDDDSIQIANPGHTSDRFHGSLDQAVNHFRRIRQAEHDRARDGIVVELSEPIEVERADPALYNLACELDRQIHHADEFLQEQTVQTLYPVGHSWDWMRGSRNQILARLRLFDQFGAVEAHFSPAELADDRLVERRLSDLWGDLLAKRSRVLMQPIFEAVREHEGL